MASGCCCMKTQQAVFFFAGILMACWFTQLIMSVDRFISAIQWSRDNPELREEGGTKVGVSGLLVIVDSSETALSILLLSATFLRDLNKLQPWFILTGCFLIVYPPLSIASYFVEVTSEPEFVMAWVLLLISMYTIWIAREFKKEMSATSLERLL